MKGFLLFIAIIIPLLFSVVAARPTEVANKYAVVIGIGQDVNSDSSARLMLSILKEAGYPMSNTILLTNRQGTKQAIIDAINWMKGVSNENSKVVFFIAAHGSSTGINVSDGMISHGRLKEYLQGMVSQNQLVIIATCQSGGAVIEGMDGVSLAAPNRIIITSSGEWTVDPATHRYTRWAEKFLLAGIKEGGADLNNDGRISIEEADTYTKMPTGLYWSQGGPTSDNYEGEFYLD